MKHGTWSMKQRNMGHETWNNGTWDMKHGTIQPFSFKTINYFQSNIGSFVPLNFIPAAANSLLVEIPCP